MPSRYRHALNQFHCSLKSFPEPLQRHSMKFTFGLARMLLGTSLTSRCTVLSICSESTPRSSVHVYCRRSSMDLSVMSIGFSLPCKCSRMLNCSWKMFECLWFKVNPWNCRILFGPWRSLKYDKCRRLFVTPISRVENPLVILKFLSM